MRGQAVSIGPDFPLKSDAPLDVVPGISKRSGVRRSIATWKMPNTDLFWGRGRPEIEVGEAFGGSFRSVGRCQSSEERRRSRVIWIATSSRAVAWCPVE